MSRAPQRPIVRAGLGLALLIAASALLLGLGLDFATASGPRFWLASQPGALALAGAAVAIAAVVASHLVRLLLERRTARAGKPDADA